MYTFELGVYTGAATQYGTVLSGPVSASEAVVEESVALSGLRPGTQYAYRITTKCGYGVAAEAPAVSPSFPLPRL